MAISAANMHANTATGALNERAGLVGAMPQQPTFHRALGDPAILTMLRNAALELGYTLG